jgi:hypothetical protein
VRNPAVAMSVPARVSTGGRAETPKRFSDDSHPTGIVKVTTDAARIQGDSNGTAVVLLRSVNIVAWAKLVSSRSIDDDHPTRLVRRRSFH